MANAFQPKPSFSAYRKWGISLRLGLILLLVLAVIVMINYLSGEHYARWRWTSHAKAELSPRTVNLLKTITNDVKIILYYDKDEPIYRDISDLLNEYKSFNSKIALQSVDYRRDAGAAQQLLTKYNFLAAGDAKNLVIFDCQGRIKSVPGNALMRYVVEQVPNQKEIEMLRKPTHFLGEMIFTSTLMSVTSPRRLNAYFLTGHGEHMPDSADDTSGYLKFAAVLQQNCIQVALLSLLGSNTVPLDCHLLVIAGPERQMEPPELEKMDQYLNQGGRLLALFKYRSVNHETGLEKILARWGIGVGQNVVKDPERTMAGTDVIVESFSPHHPIVNPLLGSRIQLILPRTITRLPTQAADAPRVEEIAFSGPRSYLEGDPATRQAFPLAVALEKGAIKGVVTERGTTRMVVMGDSICFVNHQLASGANRDFAEFAVNWLLDRTELLESLGPRPIENFKIVMTRSQSQRAQLILLAGMPGLVLAVGGLVWLRRRR